MENEKNKNILDAIPFYGNEEGIDAIIVEEEVVDAIIIEEETIPPLSVSPQSIPVKEKLVTPIQKTKQKQTVIQETEIPVIKQKKKQFSFLKIFLIIGIIIALGVATFLWKKYTDAKLESTNLEKQRVEQIIAQVNQAVAQQNYELALSTLDNINWQLNPEDNKQFVEQYNNQRENLRQIITPLKAQQDSMKLAAAFAATQQQAGIDTSIILKENEVAGLKLPFEERDIRSGISQAFKNYDVKKIIGQQDGPDFIYYSVLDNFGKEIYSFNMDFENELKLDKILTESEKVRDQYGLSIGDTYAKIKQLRGYNIKHSTSPVEMMETVAYYDNSNIIYEINGDYKDVNGTGEEKDSQVNDTWKIKYIVWKAMNR